MLEMAGIGISNGSKVTQQAMNYAIRYELALLLLVSIMMGFQIGDNHYRWLCHAAIIEAA